MRDRAAERALVDELLEVEEVAGFDPLWQVVARIRRLVPETRLHGFTTVAFAELLPVLDELPHLELTVVGEPATYSEAVDAPADPGLDVRPGRRRPHRLVRPRHLGHGGRRGRAAGAAHRGARARARAPDPRQRHLVLARPPRARDAAGAGRRGPLAAGQAHRPAAHLGGARRAVGGAGRPRGGRAAVRAVVRAVGALLDLDAVEPAELPAGLDATLRPYQVDGFRWLSLLWDCGLGGVLADDMGLGKTLQMLAMVLRAHERGELGDPVLVVAPTSVLSTWESEAARFAPSLRTVVVDRTRNKAGRGLEETIAGAQVVITSYAVARIDEVGVPVAAVGRGGARRGAVREEPPGQDLPGGAAAHRAGEVRDHRHAARELADGPLVAAVDRGARAAPAPGACSRSCGPSRSRTAGMPSGSRRCAAASGR